jgi:hypothetical protein
MCSIAPAQRQQRFETQKACKQQPGRHTIRIHRMRCGSLGHDALSTFTIRAEPACAPTGRLACAWVRMLPGNATTCRQHHSKHRFNSEGGLSSHCGCPCGQYTPHPKHSTTTNKTPQKQAEQTTLPRNPPTSEPAASLLQQQSSTSESTPVCAAARICCLLGTSGHDAPSCGLLPQHTIPGSTGATNRLHTACRLRLKETVTCFTRAACFCLLICLLSSRQQLRGACWALSSSCRLRLRAPSAE